MIRPAVAGDLDALLALARQMHAESRLRVYAFNEDKVRGLLESLTGNPTTMGVVFVAEVDGEIVGGMAGLCIEQWFSRDKVAQDLALFVRPDRRGGLAAPKLIAAFLEWARLRGAVQAELGINTGVAVDRTARLFRLSGLEPVGYLYAKGF